MTRLLTSVLILLLVAAVFGLPVANSDQPPSDQQPIVTFIGTNQYQPINTEAAEAFGVKLVIYNLDGHRNMEKMLSKDLPQDRVKAERIANERLAAMDPEQLQAAFRGIAMSIQWDISKAPAFVFNEGREVIYGVTDVEVALKRWQYHRMTR